MLDINSNNRIEGREIHRRIESKTSQYSIWVTRAIEDADLKEGKDFYTILYKSTGGRPKKEYEFAIDAAKEICLLERNNKGKEIRQWLIGLSNQREVLELITVKEAAFAFKVINCLKYIDNQKEAYNMHKTTFVNDNINSVDPKYIYCEFAKYRAKITGWDKERTDKAISDYINDHGGYNRNKLMSANMQTKMSVMDVPEAIRVAVLDILYAKHEDKTMADSFSNLCKRLANEMKVQAEQSNQKNLFRDKESIDSVNTIAIK